MFNRVGDPCNQVQVMKIFQIMNPSQQDNQLISPSNVLYDAFYSLMDQAIKIDTLVQKSPTLHENM